MPEEAAEKIGRLKANGRKRSDVRLAVSPNTKPINTDDLMRYAMPRLKKSPCGRRQSSD